jgi:lycopene beta-cyclase
VGDYDVSCDVLVLGSGPAACAIASLLGRQDFDVVLADQNADRAWVPNYGAWKDEWEAVLDRYAAGGVQITGGNCGSGVDREWSTTDCFFGGSFDKPMEERMRLDRPYLRLDRSAIKDSFLSTNAFQVLKANHRSKAIGVNLYSPAGSLVHDEEGTTTQMVTAEGETKSVRSKLVVDCTGHESLLVLKDARDRYRPPGFQIAYGILVDVAESGSSSPSSSSSSMIGPYDKEAMTLFDYRTDHFSDPAAAKRGEAAPTFMYSMPLKDNQIFFEETSLVARPGLSFQECKDRCMERLRFHGIEVLKTYEEEYCYIPMGGALPAKDQRIIALGGSAAMVHPATGYHACRCLIGATDVAKALAAELRSPSPNLDRAAASAYHALWSPGNVRQRNFAVFGGEFLMKQNVMGLRGFFDGFFRLPLPQWAGFLAGWPGLPNNDQHETWLARILYGLNFIVRLPPTVALDMLSSIVTYSIQEGTPLLQSVTPLFGEPGSYEYKRNDDRVGDVAAKMEARRMIRESTITEELPIPFDDESLPASPRAEDRAASVSVESFQ